MLTLGARSRVPPQTTTTFSVSMTCNGCVNAVKRILGKMEGVTDIKTDVDAKVVEVTGSADPQTMLQALKKWGDAAGKTVALRT